MQLEIGKIYEGKVTGITKFGAFVEIESGTTGMVHISEVANTFVNEIKDHVTEGQTVKVKVLTVGDDGKISLSMKKAVEAPPKKEFKKDFRNDKGRADFTRKPQGAYGQGNNNNRSSRPQGGNPGYKADVWEPKKQQSENFEDMLSKFKQSSEEKQCDLKKIFESKRGCNSRRSSGK